MLAEKYLPQYTVEDYKQWKGDWELIEGIPFAMTPFPFGIHQKITAKISHFLLSNFENCPENEPSVYVELDWIINDTTLVRPDVSVTCKVIEEFIKEPPEAVFEVISKSTVLKDEKVKFEIYQNEGVKYYIIVYPDIQKVRGFKLTNKKYEKIFDSNEGILELKICGCKARIEVTKLFK